MIIISDTDKHATGTHMQVINTHRLFCEHKSLVHLGKYLREALLDCIISVLQNIMLCVCPGSAWRSENKLWTSVLSFFLLYGLWELNSGCQVQCIYLLGHLTGQINIPLFFKETAKFSPHPKKKNFTYFACSLATLRMVYFGFRFPGIQSNLVEGHHGQNGSVEACCIAYSYLGWLESRDCSEWGWAITFKALPLVSYFCQPGFNFKGFTALK